MGFKQNLFDAWNDILIYVQDREWEGESINAPMESLHSWKMDFVIGLSLSNPWFEEGGVVVSYLNSSCDLSTLNIRAFKFSALFSTILFLHGI